VTEKSTAVPGYRLFKCESCDHQWKEKTTNYMSASCVNCPGCGHIEYPMGYEKHYDDKDSIGKFLKDTEEFEQELSQEAYEAGI